MRLHDVDASPYATAAQTAADMITTDEAAALAGTTRVTINAWIQSGRCIAAVDLPEWPQTSRETHARVET